MLSENRFRSLFSEFLNMLIRIGYTMVELYTRDDVVHSSLGVIRKIVLRV
jgi:hypothetical protein